MISRGISGVQLGNKVFNALLHSFLYAGGGDELQKQVQELTSGLTQNFEGAKGL